MNKWFDRKYENVSPPKAFNPEPYLTPRVFTQDKAEGTRSEPAPDNLYAENLLYDGLSSKGSKHTLYNTSSLLASDNSERAKKPPELIHYNPQYKCTVYNLPDLKSFQDVVTLQAGIHVGNRAGMQKDVESAADGKQDSGNPDPNNKK